MTRHLEPLVRRATPRPRAAQQGSIIVLFAVALVLLLGLAGLAVDAGALVMARRNYQKIADTCVLAGAQGIPGGTGVARATACTTSNGLATGVTVNLPPASGARAGDTGFVELRISVDQPTYFMRALGATSVPVGARSVAGAYRQADYAIMGLRPSGDPVHTEGSASSNIIGNACSRLGFRVDGGLNMPGYYAVANGTFPNQLPTSAGNLSGAGTDPCLDPLYPMPALPGYTTPPPSPDVLLNSPPVCPTTGTTTTVGPARTVTINCTDAAKAGTIRVQGPVDQVLIEGAGNRSPVEFLSGSTYRTVDVQGIGEIRLAPSWYHSIRVRNSAPVRLQGGLYYVNSHYFQDGSATLQSLAGVSLIVGHQFELAGSGSVALSCCAASMQNDVLIYHRGDCDSVAGLTCTATNQIHVRGSSSTRTLNGSIYSPLNLPDACTDCIFLEGGTAPLQINGQVIGAEVHFAGQGLTVNRPTSGGLAARPFLAE